MFQETELVVGINADLRQTKTATFTVLHSGYYDLVQAAGAIPIILPPSDKRWLADILRLVDAVILTGGDDLDPRKDGWVLHSTVTPMLPRRNEWDRALAKHIRDCKIPVLGIGAGMQLLNVVSGGNLYLDIREDCPRAIRHHDPDPAHSHAMEIEYDSFLGRFYAGLDSMIRVISRHHQAVDRIAPGFRVTGACPDGIVEAIESLDPAWLAVGLQFHPEVSEASQVDRQLIEAFVTEVRNRSAIAPRAA